MNKRIENPLIVRFSKDTDDRTIQVEGRRITVPTNAAWTNYKNAIYSAIQNKDNAYDSVIVHIGKNIDLDQKGIINSITIKMNEIIKAAGEDRPVLNDATTDTWYLMNPSYNEQKAAHPYAPSDEAVLEKYGSFSDQFAWQKHQATVWSRMADMMPLSEKEGYGTPNHLGQLTEPKRGLAKEDVSDFWSFKSNKILSPALMGDDMVGMPSISGREYDGFTMVVNGAETPIKVKSLKTVGMSGIAIPMANVKGDVPKYQVATDPSKINVMLKARAADGVSIQKSEYFDKKKNQFLFKLSDGRDSKLTVQKAETNGTVTFRDMDGEFSAHMKDNVYDLLKGRGYDIPSMITKLTVEPNAKYIWQSRGEMAGSEEVFKTVSPSQAGFIVASEPKNEEAKYDVYVVEGALKGHIVAKYINSPDKDGFSFGGQISGDHGIIVAQVPGVAAAFVESVKPIYEELGDKVGHTLICMDADGRDNLAVANGIDTAYKCLSEAVSDVRVVSWDSDKPDVNVKGLDDALLSVYNGKITLKEMSIQFGTPEELFPKDKAKAPNPYRLDGTRANGEGWKIEYTEDRIAKDKVIRELQEETKLRAAGLLLDVSHEETHPEKETDVPAKSPVEDKTFTEPVKKEEPDMSLKGLMALPRRELVDCICDYPDQDAINVSTSRPIGKIAEWVRDNDYDMTDKQYYAMVRNFARVVEIQKRAAEIADHGDDLGDSLPEDTNGWQQ